MKYNAFISYRHSELDMAVAKYIHKGLETLKIPRPIQKKIGKKNIKRVFRDQEELPIGSDLGDNIRQALTESEFLIVICSPRSKESYWVQKEIETFIEIHGREHILAVLIEGEPEDSFSKLLLEDEEGNAIEPLAADLRAENPKAIRKKLKIELLRLAAPLLGCSFDDLRQRHKERKMKKLVFAISTVAVLGVLFGIYSSYNAWLIHKNFEEKQRNESKFMAEKAEDLFAYGDRRAATLLAMEAMPGKEGKRPYVAPAELALSTALRCYDTGNLLEIEGILQHELAVRDFSFSLDGSKIVSVDSGNGVYVFDSLNLKQLCYVYPEWGDYAEVRNVKLATITTEGNLFIARDNEFVLQKLDGTVLNRNIYAETMEDHPSIVSAVTDRTANLAVLKDLDGIFVVDLKTGSVIDQVKNPTDYSFSGDMVFSGDHQSIAIPHYVKNGDLENGFVSVYHLDSKKMQTYQVAFNYIEELYFTDDGQLVVLSMDGSNFENVHMRNGKFIRTLQKIDLNTQEVLWEKDLKSNYYAVNEMGPILTGRTISNKSQGGEQSEVCIAIDRAVLTLDANNGELISRVPIGSEIVSLKLAKSEPFGFVTSHEGEIYVCNMETGDIYRNSVIYTGKDAVGMNLQNGVVVVREKYSPDLLVMNYKKANGIEELTTLDFGVSSMSFSKNDDYYAVEGSRKSQNIIQFFQTDKDQLIEKWNPDLGGACAHGTFLDNDTYLAIGNNGTLGFYDVSKKKEEYLKWEDVYYDHWYLTVNKEYILLVDHKEYKVIDLQKRKVLYEGEMEESIKGYSLSEDGKKIAFYFKAGEIIEIQLDKKISTSIKVEEFSISSVLLGGMSMVYSPDGKYLACACLDQKLRMIDLDSQTIKTEIPFVGGNRSFMGFVEDTTDILFEGDDHIIYVYDFEKEELLYASQNQYPLICEMNKKADRILLKMNANMLLLNAEDYQIILDNAEIKLISIEKDAVYCEHNNTIYRFPYMNEEKLYEEVEKQYEGDCLSDQERIRFNVK